MKSYKLQNGRKPEIIDAEKPITEAPKGRTWIHLHPRTDKDLAQHMARFMIHPLTLEDCMNPHSRIKLEIFPDYIFFIFRGLHLSESKTRIESRNFNFIITKNTLFTITLDHRNTINDMIEEWHVNQSLLRDGLDFIVHKILDVETDHNLSIIYRIEDQAEDIEKQVFQERKNLNLNTIFQMRGNLQKIKKIIHQHTDILSELEKRKINFFSKDSTAFFRDVKDHSLKILDSVEDIKDMISSALEVHLTVSSRRSNEIMKILTIMTSIMLPMSIITGIYGMNFKKIPMLESEIGFFIALGIMTTIGSFMTLYFKIRKWF